MTSPHGSSEPDTGAAPDAGSAAERGATPDPSAAAPNPSILARRNAPTDGTGADYGSSPNDGHASDDSSAAEHAIESALQGLRGLDDLPVADHVERFDTVHTALTEALGRTENHQSGPHGGS